MIDLHCHILPGVDDGSVSVDCSVKMARMAAESGVTAICATPHFRVNSIEECRMQNQLCLERFPVTRDALAKVGVELYPGAEISCDSNVPEYLRAGLLPTLAGTQYLLCEFLYDDTVSFMDDILGQIRRLGYIPVIAHPERYDVLCRDVQTLIRWFEYGYIIQLTKGSLLGYFGGSAERCALWVLDSGIAHVLSSDAHRHDGRTPRMEEVCRLVSDVVGDEYLRILTEENPLRILRGQEVVPV